MQRFFDSKKDEIWSRIADDIGGEFIDKGFWKDDVLVYRAKSWQIVLDTYTVHTNNSAQTFTRMRAPFVNEVGLRFKIYREGFFSSIGKAFGMQDIEVMDPYFDDRFIIKGNDPDRIKQLLSDPELKALIQKQPRIHFEVRDKDGLFGAGFPEGVDQLYFQRHGVMKKTEELKSLFDLFVRALGRMVEIQVASPADPGVDLSS